MKSALTIFTATALAASVGVTSLAHEAHADGIEDAIKARQGYYQMVSFNFGGIISMLKGETEYSADGAQTFADNIKALSELNGAAMWPQGSDNVAMKGKTRAKPEIWTTFPAIGEKAKAFKVAAAAMAEGAGNGKEALGPLVGALGASCKGCHQEYRAKSF